jgi:hypothetical protein
MRFAVLAPSARLMGWRRADRFDVYAGFPQHGASLDTTLAFLHEGSSPARRSLCGNGRRDTLPWEAW